MVDNHGREHQLQAFGFDMITDETQTEDLNKVQTMFPDAPREVFERPDGPIDILVESMYKKIMHLINHSHSRCYCECASGFLV